MWILMHLVQVNMHDLWNDHKKSALCGVCLCVCVRVWESVYVFKCGIYQTKSEMQFLLRILEIFSNNLL